MSTPKKAVIIGAGPAGLTAAYELLDKTDVVPVVLEARERTGGLSTTINYKGNRIDIGGHRFFSKSDRVMDWWLRILPVQGAPARDDLLLGRELNLDRAGGRRVPADDEEKAAHAPDPEKCDEVMLIRKRLSRIFFLRKFFPYPISLNLSTIFNLGVLRTTKIGLSYLKAFLFPIRREESLEDFFINRFGRELYKTFFEDYTEKVWGVPCRMIKPEWGAQRIKGLSVSRALLHALKRMVRRESTLDQKGTETSLIEQFLYPKYGPGQMWEAVAALVKEKGGDIRLGMEVVEIELQAELIRAVIARNTATGELERFEGDYVFSSMPVKDLVSSFGAGVPSDVKEVAEGLVYRDFVTVGVLLRQLAIKNRTGIPTLHDLVPDNWIYIQESDVKIGRLQIFNNWSPYMVSDPETVWIGVEYFCQEGDEFWRRTDSALSDLAVEELARIGFIEPDDVLDTVVIRMPKAYPAYFGTYDRFQEIRAFLDRCKNLFPIGRNGQHRYNNQDHSMLAAMAAVQNILSGEESKENLWSVNAEQDYHEERNSR
ncbi:MAG: NAD(P)/FAD-dependent oxidoreductase [Acidobacteriota bacterium]